MTIIIIAAVVTGTVGILFACDRDTNKNRYYYEIKIPVKQISFKDWSSRQGKNTRRVWYV